MQPYSLILIISGSLTGLHTGRPHLQVAARTPVALVANNEVISPTIVNLAVQLPAGLHAGNRGRWLSMSTSPVSADYLDVPSDAFDSEPRRLRYFTGRCKVVATESDGTVTVGWIQAR